MSTPNLGLGLREGVMSGYGGVRGEQGLGGWDVATSNRLHFRSLRSCLDFDAVFQQGFREGYSGVPKLPTRLSIFT